MKTYILIAIKPESSDYCKCCLMDRWPAEHETYFALGQQDCIEIAAGLHSRELADREAGFNITVLSAIEGNVVALNLDDGYQTDSDCPNTDLEAIRTLALQLSAEQVRAREQAKVNAAEKKKTEDTTRQRLAEQRELLRLQQKYGP